MEIGFVRQYVQADEDRTSTFQMNLVKMPIDNKFPVDLSSRPPGAPEDQKWLAYSERVSFIYAHCNLMPAALARILQFRSRKTEDERRLWD
jgi:hypothetical protein